MVQLIGSTLLSRCGDCQHVWAVAYLPMNMDKALRAMRRATCPICASLPSKHFVASESDAAAWRAGEHDRGRA